MTFLNESLMAPRSLAARPLITLLRTDSDSCNARSRYDNL
jgi:hypothetical protein